MILGLARALESSTMAMASTEGAFLSADDGSSWKAVLTKDVAFAASSTCCVVAEPNRVLFGFVGGIGLVGRNGVVQRIFEAESSTTCVTQIAIGDLWLAATNYGMLRSGNLGNSWEGASMGLLEADMTGVVLSNSEMGPIAFSSGSVYLWRKHMFSWDLLPIQFPGRAVQVVRFHREPLVLFEDATFAAFVDREWIHIPSLPERPITLVENQGSDEAWVLDSHLNLWRLDEASSSWRFAHAVNLPREVELGYTVHGASSHGIG